MVGIDGSRSSLDALTWAVHEAQGRNLPLRLVHAVDYGNFVMGFNPAASESFFKYVETAGQKFLDEAQQRVEALAPEVEVSVHNLVGRPAQLLEEQSKDAFLTVVGSSGLHGFTGLLAGSVAVALTAHGHSPVVVVRSSGAHAGGPVVVGVSGTPDGEEAIGWAFQEASMRGAKLLAVLVSSYVPAYFDYIEPTWEELPGPARKDQQAMLLAERLAGWQEKFPEVAVRRVVAAGHPGHVLLGYAQRAQLIVTGTRGHGNVAGWFLGSTSHRLVQHAECPVLVARSTARPSDR
ncbi:universal stress protein [Mycobacterium sp. CBMA226]|nr:universal stress protein [Mycolicibacterium sp. CBMA 226]